jgi:hypothetical protein
MPPLTADERVTLEAIRDTGMVSRRRYAWAREKGYAEPGGRYRYKLTREGLDALLPIAADSDSNNELVPRQA